MTAAANASPSRFYRATIAGALVFACGVFVFSLLYARYADWNAIRIAPAAAMLHGQAIYAPETSGVVTSHIYTPLGALAYAPVAWLHDISTMMSAGSLLALVYFALPFIWLAVRAVRRGELAVLDAVGVTVAALLVAGFDPGLGYAAFMVHVEAPAVGLASLAIVIAAEAGMIGSWGWAGAGVLAVGAILCKQTLLPTWLVLGLAIAGLGGRLAALRYVAGSTVAAGLFAGGLMLFGDWPAFYYNCVWLPGHHPWRTYGYVFAFGAPPMAQGLLNRAQVLSGAFAHIALLWWPAFAAALWCLLRRWPAKTAEKEPLAVTAVFAAAVAVAQFPLALVSSVKVGGDVNSFAPLLTPLLLLLAALALGAFAPVKGALVTTARQLLAAALIVLIGCNVPRFALLAQEGLTRAEPNREMVDFLRAHPEEVYLPWNPLHTWVAEGRRDHFEYGVFDRALAGRPMTTQHYLANLPKHLRWVAVRRGHQLCGGNMDMFRHYLPNLREVPSPPWLEAWIFYEVSLEGIAR